MSALRKNEYSCPECFDSTNSLRTLFYHLINEHLWSNETAEAYISKIELNKGLNGNVKK